MAFASVIQPCDSSRRVGMSWIGAIRCCWLVVETPNQAGMATKACHIEKLIHVAFGDRGGYY